MHSSSSCGYVSLCLNFLRTIFSFTCFRAVVIFLANSDSPLEVCRNVSCFTSLLSWRLLPSPCQQCHYLLPLTSDEAHSRLSTFASTSTVFCVFPLLAPFASFQARYVGWCEYLFQSICTIWCLSNWDKPFWPSNLICLDFLVEVMAIKWLISYAF